MSTKRQKVALQTAYARAREGAHEDEGAEIIDLVHLPTGTRPTPIAYLEYDEVNRCRDMDCLYYQRCLNFVARVRWRSFHCRQCPHYRAQECFDHEEDRARTGETAAIIKLR